MDRTLREILLAHAKKYPLMEPQDGVKLIYQNEFGGGHLIANPDKSLERLQAELAGVSRDGAAPLAEDIGGGMVRVMLAALDGAGYSPEALNRDFVRSAHRRRGGMDAFRDKLDTLRALAAEGVFQFSAQALERYLSAYFAAGCPAVSHSQAYRAAYRPAYRVVERALCLPLLAEEVQRLSRERGRVLVALDGRCAAGKTTLAAELETRLGWTAAHMDHFFLRPEQRTPERFAQPGGNVDWERFLEEVLRPLRAGKTPVYRPFDCRSQTLLGPVPFAPGPVVLVEGSYACHPALWDQYDVHVFLTVDPQTQMARITAREGTEYAQVFQARWIPLEEAYFSACRVEERCEYHLLTPTSRCRFSLK